MEQSPKLTLSYVMPAQAQKHVTVNETFRRLDQLVQSSVVSRVIAAEPASPVDGDAYILPASPTGDAWDNYTQHSIAAFQDGAWTEIIPEEGFRVWDAGADEFIIFDGAAWAVVSGGGGGSESAAKFGVNATADTTNRLSVKSDAILFSHDDVTPGSGDSQIKVNKAAAGDTASHLFQTGFSGRAEFGLTGDDDFHIKVSPDGSSWTDAVFIDKDNGRVGVGTSSPSSKLHVSGDNLYITNTNANSPRCYVEASDISGFVYFGWDNGPIAQVGTQSNHPIRFMTNNVQRLRIGASGGVQVGSPTGGNKGAGSINAQAVYDDNTLLSCYVFDQALDGTVDLDKWDGKVPDLVIRENETEISRSQRRHTPLRKFAERIGGAHDPLTLDGYAKHWREKRHLTSMPNEASFDPEEGMAAGEWIQRLIETVEIQAVLIDKLHRRLSAVETKPRQKP